MDSHQISLQTTFDALNLAYFDNTIQGVRIKWAPRRNPKNGPRKIITWGMYYGDSGLITIHPVLGHEWVPHHVRASIVFHEMIHHVLPDTQYGDHTEEFYRLERRNPLYKASVNWIDANFGRLLAARCPEVLP